ncbi:hypothetical protein CF319_g2925 [Tilletia indica]|uniref:Sm protein G n=2 Tax=Tilletia TaxID=13289 RepID=A0A8X7T7T4_9BASI|nr:hypothetical protein CF327_g2387 [Tilletia walkeri]KAE8224142.1 hypothetical protein CF319_g2925 [Tilletia indica]KAE8230014.1 hypothetical protein CF326_g4993 [Tilletia indica]KAE8251095.1 hypothetical protein A4X13_0g4160 [Tilletia indica]KAE8270663.1 hypothetical protein A4X09_0g1689 [Tilletia walkeri]
MSKVAQPELKRYIDKRVAVNINGGRRITGTLRGYDVFMNIVVENAIEQLHPIKGNLNLWKDGPQCGTVVVRGASVTMVEGLEPVKT